MCKLYVCCYALCIMGACVCAYTCAVGLQVLSQVFALPNELAVEDGFESLISCLQLCQCHFFKHTVNDNYEQIDAFKMAS